ncbi:MAG: ABC transporter, partial [Cyanobacteria bacterium J06588_4]
YGATILLTSHYMADITALCDRVLLIHQGQLIYDGLLDDLLDRFAPYRQVKVELAQALSAEKLANFGEVKSIQGRGESTQNLVQEVSFIVPREELTATIANILAQLEVQDLSVSDPPIEEIIGRLFATGKAD